MIKTEECAFRFVTLSLKDDQLNGIELLKLAYTEHKDESKVVESICHVFQELTVYGKNRIFRIEKRFIYFFLILSYIKMILSMKCI